MLRFTRRAAMSAAKIFGADYGALNGCRHPSHWPPRQGHRAQWGRTRASNRYPGTFFFLACLLLLAPQPARLQAASRPVVDLFRTRHLASTISSRMCIRGRWVRSSGDAPFTLGLHH